MSTGTPEQARAVLDFWFGEPESKGYGTQHKTWFSKDNAFDQTIRDRFGPVIEQALRGEFEAWAGEPHAALAEIILLDQFTRNAFRDTARAFAGDARALGVASAMVGARGDEELPPFMRAFVYMPFEHAEGVGMQDEAVRLFTRLAATDPEQADWLDYAYRHRAVIERFGRFPHRNDSLGRQSTAEEIAYLKEPGSGF
ncbi:MAG: DUF924 family protein [Caldimonas sp.]